MKQDRSKASWEKVSADLSLDRMAFENILTF